MAPGSAGDRGEPRPPGGGFGLLVALAPARVARGRRDRRGRPARPGAGAALVQRRCHGGAPGRAVGVFPPGSGWRPRRRCPGGVCSSGSLWRSVARAGCVCAAVVPGGGGGALPDRVRRGRAPRCSPGSPAGARCSGSLPGGLVVGVLGGVLAWWSRPGGGRGGAGAWAGGAEAGLGAGVIEAVVEVRGGGAVAVVGWTRAGWARRPCGSLWWSLAVARVLLVEVLGVPAAAAPVGSCWPRSSCLGEAVAGARARPFVSRWWSGRRGPPRSRGGPRGGLAARAALGAAAGCGAVVGEAAAPGLALRDSPVRGARRAVAPVGTCWRLCSSSGRWRRPRAPGLLRRIRELGAGGRVPGPGLAWRGPGRVCGRRRRGGSCWPRSSGAVWPVRSPPARLERVGAAAAWRRARRCAEFWRGVIARARRGRCLGAAGRAGRGVEVPGGRAAGWFFSWRRAARRGAGLAARRGAGGGRRAGAPDPRGRAGRRGPRVRWPRRGGVPAAAAGPGAVSR